MSQANQYVFVYQTSSHLRQRGCIKYLFKVLSNNKNFHTLLMSKYYEFNYNIDNVKGFREYFITIY